jgi:branched-chain amino acid transport system ATP-binding protein
MALLELDNVNAGYETGQVLFNVNLSLDKGEIVSLLGRNGAGKTTLIYTIMGTQPPNVLDGSIYYNDTDIIDLPPNKRANRGISIVPQGRRLWPRLTVAENIQLAIDQSENPHSMERVMSYFPDLESLSERQAYKLSGGQQQMVAISRALVRNPRVILLDEPSEGLAPKIIRDVESIIHEIHEEEEIAILLVEQNIETAFELCDSHYILNKGELVDEFSSKELAEDQDTRQKYLGV